MRRKGQKDKVKIPVGPYDYIVHPESKSKGFKYEYTARCTRIDVKLTLVIERM